ncbi:hypothetical protein GYMLUDRAFT_997358, partial [Collybiopsis luxurians FD-317 M1]
SRAGSSPLLLANTLSKINNARQILSHLDLESCSWYTRLSMHQRPTLDVYDFRGSRVAMSICIVDESIPGFAHSSLKMTLMKKMPLFMETKNSIMKSMMVGSRIIF